MRSSADEPSSQDFEAFLALALVLARKLALERVNDHGRYTLIFSGPKTRRRAGAHVHILLSNSRIQKAWLYFVLAGKNLLQAAGLRRDKKYQRVALMEPDASLERARDRYSAKLRRRRACRSAHTIYAGMPASQSGR